ncbi:hypothetical protein GQ53DRAFT_754617 [Thozetella sp. PMI_491]|nr:hypothetical protein GQ53DRAFT_754617 [Thozetella sp. PMI_491]
MPQNANAAFFTIPIAYTVAQLGGVYSKRLASQVFDNAQPRDYLAAVMKDNSIDKATKARIRRADAAEANSLATLTLFGPAVAIASVAAVPAETINGLAVSYLALRIAYMGVYIWAGGNRNLWPLRSLTHWGSVFVAVSLYVIAGLQV